MPLPQIINWRGTLFERQLQDALDYLDDNLGGSLADLGVTATAAELNQLDGVTLGTFAEEDTADYIQSQATWNTGADTTESTITAAKLQAKLDDYEQQIGVGQTWQDVSGSRTHSTSYQNTTGKPIAVFIRADPSTTRDIFVSTTGAFSGEEVQVGRLSSGDPTAAARAEFIVPNGHYYRINGSVTINNWNELR